MRPGDFEFALVDRRVAFQGAVDECEKRGGVLAVPFNQAENDLIAQMASFLPEDNLNVWIGEP